MVPQKLKKTLVIMKIMSSVYFLLATALVAFIAVSSAFEKNPEQAYTLTFFVILTMSLGIFLFKINKGLKSCKYWSWVAGIIVSSLMITSIFFPLGIPSLMGLLAKETRDYIKLK